MKRTRSLITLCILSLALLAPEIAEAQIPIPKPTVDIQTQLKNIQTQLKTIQNQIATLPPTWSRRLPASERFVVLAEFNNEAVLDKETGLVWQGVPSSEHVAWHIALRSCTKLSVGGRQGWRLPTVEELTSLEADTSLQGVFVGTTPRVEGKFWSATCWPGWVTEFAWTVDFSQHLVGSESKDLAMGGYWCVRGGQGYQADY